MVEGRGNSREKEKNTFRRRIWTQSGEGAGHSREEERDSREKDTVWRSSER